MPDLSLAIPFPPEDGHPPRQSVFAPVEAGLKAGATDWQFKTGEPIYVRVFGEVQRLQEPICTSESLQALAQAALGSPTAIKPDIDASFAHEGDVFRFHSFSSRGQFCFNLRHVPKSLRSLKSLGVPPAFASTALNSPRGLILVSGPAGSGKSTTLAASIDYLIRNRASMILTLEDPVEYRHSNQRGVIRQMEKGRDFESFSEALRGALRCDPDILMVGEMRDLETVAAALTAAETGHLVLGTLHSGSARDAVSRIVDLFPAARAGEVRTQLGKSLVGVLAQQLVRSGAKRLVGAFELLLATPAVRNLITEPGGNYALLANEISTGSGRGMISMDQSLEALWRQRLISRSEALRYAFYPAELETALITGTHNE